MNKLLISINLFHQTLQCNFCDENLNNNLYGLFGGSIIYDFNKLSLGVSVQTTGYRTLLCGVDVFSKIYNRNVNIYILSNIFSKKPLTKWSCNALCEIPELRKGLYVGVGVGININRLEKYNVSFQVTYNKKFYSKKRINYYFKGAANIKAFIKTGVNQETPYTSFTEGSQAQVYEIYMLKERLYKEVDSNNYLKSLLNSSQEKVHELKIDFNEKLTQEQIKNTELKKKLESLTEEANTHENINKELITPFSQKEADSREKNINQGLTTPVRQEGKRASEKKLISSSGKKNINKALFTPNSSTRR